MVRRFFGLLLALTALSALSCKEGLEKMKEQAKERRDKRQGDERATLDQTYQALQFLKDGMPSASSLETVACDDPPLRKKYKPTARICTRLPTIDYPYLQHLLGARSQSKEYQERWAWMRRGGVERLGPTAEIDERFDLQRAAKVADKIRTGHIGVFTPLPEGASSEPDRYQGFLVIVDVTAKEPVCQLKLDVEVGKIFSPPSRQKGFSEIQDSPRDYQSKFWLKVNHELRSITKVFCTNYPS